MNSIFDDEDRNDYSEGFRDGMEDTFERVISVLIKDKLTNHILYADEYKDVLLEKLNKMKNRR